MDFDDVTPMIQNIIVMDSDGKRIAVKYYNDEWYARDRSVCSLAASDGTPAGASNTRCTGKQ
jgi:hypothetical protein